MNKLKQLLQRHNALLVVLFAQFFVPVFAESQTLESLNAKVSGQGTITLAAEERKLTSALVVLRQNGNGTYCRLFGSLATSRGNMVAE